MTYRPDRVTLRALLESLAGQVGATLVVDNTGTNGAPVVPADIPAVSAVLPQRRNLGLAQAQNVGMAWAKERGFRYVLLLDQDSRPGADMVHELLVAYEALDAIGRVAAVGPLFHDLRDGREAPFVRVGFPFNRLFQCEPGRATVECDFLISSGALIPMAVLDHVGGMNAGLFIDNVDLEWSFRARSMGYALHGVCAATMHHRLGDMRRSLPFGLGRVVVHGPVRLYFIMRNRVLLYRMRHVPRVWVAQDLPRLFAKLFLFGVLIGPRLAHWRYMLRGLWDGMRGQSGCCPVDED